MNKFCQVLFGCETKEESEKIANVLLDNKLIACADGFDISSKYRWKSKRINEKRYQVIAYSAFDKKDKIIDIIKTIHSDELPSIIFIPIEANNEYLEWIEKELK